MVTDKMVEAFANSFWPTSSEIVIDRYGSYIRAALEAALSASDAPAVAVKALEWNGMECRSSRGDLYSIHRLSENVWVARKNGTSISDWHGTEDAAKAAAQADYETPRSEHVNGGAYRRISVDEWNSLGGDRNKLCDWHEGIGYVIYDDQALKEFKARHAELAAAPKEASHE